MRFSDLQPAYQDFLRDLLTRLDFDPDRFLIDPCADDEMFYRGVLPGYPNRAGAALFRYIESALRTFDVYRQIVDHIGGFEQLDRVLDFGSGHGRLTRALVHRMDRRRIWVCDIFPSAVAWQAESFGVNGLVSVSDPDLFGLQQVHDLVFSASVFSHFPQQLFERWLTRLFELVSPRGLLAFSVHDAALAPMDHSLNADGIAYGGWSESQTLDASIYGMGYVTPTFVLAAITKACGPERAAAARRFPQGLFENQDLWIVPQAGADIQMLNLRIRPVGGFVGRPRPGEWSGWGIDPNVGAQIVKADLYVGERHVQTATPSADNDSILRFFPGAPNIGVSWRFPREISRDRGLLRVELTSSTGMTAQCYASGEQLEAGAILRS